uniref:uncharacterized protein n=1 Tax=Myxine glutinosa TaxID=7769 RepID=UPI00358F2083
MAETVRTMVETLFGYHMTKPAVVQVQYYVDGNSFGAEKHFLEELRSCLKKESLKLECTKYLFTCGSPVLLFCVDASNVSSDVKRALGHIDGRPAILIMMNNVPKNSIRIDPHSASLVQEKNVHPVLDWFFSYSDGMYDCEENNEVVKQVTNHLLPMVNSLQLHDDGPRFLAHLDALHPAFKFTFEMEQLHTAFSGYPPPRVAL